MTRFNVSLFDIKFFLCLIFFVYLYFRKKHKVFAITAFAGFLYLFLSKTLGLVGGLNTLLLAILLSVAYIISYKELNELHKKGIDAKSALNLDIKDLVVFVALILTWIAIKSY